MEAVAPLHELALQPPQVVQRQPWAPQRRLVDGHLEVQLAVVGWQAIALVCLTTSGGTADGGGLRCCGCCLGRRRRRCRHASRHDAAQCIDNSLIGVPPSPRGRSIGTRERLCTAGCLSPVLAVHPASLLPSLFGQLREGSLVVDAVGGGDGHVPQLHDVVRRLHQQLHPLREGVGDLGLHAQHAHQQLQVTCLDTRRPLVVPTSCSSCPRATTSHGTTAGSTAAANAAAASGGPPGSRAIGPCAGCLAAAGTASDGATRPRASKGRRSRAAADGLADACGAAGAARAARAAAARDTGDERPSPIGLFFVVQPVALGIHQLEQQVRRQHQLVSRIRRREPVGVQPLREVHERVHPREVATQRRQRRHVGVQLVCRPRRRPRQRRPHLRLQHRVALLHLRQPHGHVLAEFGHEHDAGAP